MTVLRSPSRILLPAVLIIFLSGAGPATELQRTPPRPLPGNPAPAYPERARSKGVEGDVRVRIHVSEHGDVEDVEILSVPEEQLGFEEAVRAAALKWRFAPATENGHAVPATFEDAFGFYLTFPDTQGRIYPLSSREAWDAVLDLFRTMKLRFKALDEANHVAISRWRNPDKFLGLGDLLLDGRRADPASIQLHVFVSPFAEPARVYANTIIKANQRIYFNSGIVERWFYDQLEARLGRSGLPLPKNPDRRRILAAKLLGREPDPACPVDLETLSKSPAGFEHVDGVVLPKLIAITRIKPFYPEDKRRQRREAKIVVAGVVYEDGWIGDLHVHVDCCNRPEDEFGISAAETVSFWRYRPGTVGGRRCPFPLNVLVRYIIR